MTRLTAFARILGVPWNTSDLAQLPRMELSERPLSFVARATGKPWGPTDQARMIAREEKDSSELNRRKPWNTRK
jgi:hypothetical protein